MTLVRRSKWADLGVRSASAGVLMPVAIAAAWAGGAWFGLFAGAIGLLMAYEWVAIAHAGAVRQMALHGVAAISPVVLLHDAGMQPTLAIIGLCWLASIVLPGSPAGHSIWSRVGVGYVSLPILALVTLRHSDVFGVWALLWCMVIVWAADVLAYFAGRIIGGPKLAPRLSPKKTWAGMGGAVVGAAMASLLFSYFNSLTFLPLAVIAGLMAFAEQGGDICESALKRFHDVKDSSNLIPGHGGVLDRIDGLVVVVVIAAAIGLIHNSTNVAAGLLHW